MDDILRRSLALLLCAGLLTGCGAVAAGTAGGVAATELEEEDETFDPLEETEVYEETEELLP